MSQAFEVSGESTLALRETAPVRTAAHKRPITIEGAWTTLLSCLIGGGIAMTGFPPLNNVSDVLHTQALPLLILLSPACLLALLAVWAVWRSQPDLRWLTRVPPTATLCLVLVSLGGATSLLQSTQPGYSAALLAAGILAPALIFLSVRSGALNPSYMAGAFIAVLVVLLGRADLVFLSHNGLPTAQALFNAKFSSRPYDFHYYTLGNPNHTAAFLLIPLALCLFWAMGRSTRRSTRRWLLLASGMILVTVFLLYVRLADLFAVAVLIAAVLSSPWPTRIRRGIVGIVIAVVVAFGAASPGHYLLHIFQTSNGSSGAVRIGSLEAGWNALLHHPLTGVGLGMFRSSTVPAHSSIVQAGAEMGVLGLLGLAAITVSVVWVAVRSVRSGEWSGFRGAASLSAATYVIYTALSGGAAEGLMVGFISIYGLTLAMAAGIGVSASAEAEDRHVPLTDAVRALSATAGRRVRLRWLAIRPGLPWIAYGAARTARFTSYAFGPLRRLLVAIAHPIRQLIAAGIESGRTGAQVMHAVDGERVREAALRTGGAALRSRYSYMALALVVLGLVGRHYFGGLPATTVPVPRTTVPLPGDPVEPLGVHLKPPVRSWTSTGMLSSWVPQVPRVKATSANGTLDVLTSPQPEAYQLMSPKTALHAGQYVAVVRGQVQDGGLVLGVLDAKSQKWVKTATFTSNAKPSPGTMPVFFSLSKPTTVDIVLANYSPSKQVSHWRVRVVSIKPDGLPASQRSPAPSHAHPQPRSARSHPRKSPIA